KMDRVGADFERVVGMMRERLGANAHPVHYPIGEGEKFAGVIDIIRRVELIFDDSTLGKNWTEQPVRAELVDRVEQLRINLVEAAVEHHEELMVKYLDGEEISEAELRVAIRAATIANAMVPVACGSAFKNKGVQQLLDAVIDFMP